MLRVWFRFRDWTMGASVCQSIDRVCCERTHMRQPLFLYFHNCLKPANACSIVIDTPSNVSNAIAKCTMTCRILSQFYRLVSLLLDTVTERHLPALNVHAKATAKFKTNIQTHETWSSFRVTQLTEKVFFLHLLCNNVRTANIYISNNSQLVN